MFKNLSREYFFFFNSFPKAKAENSIPNALSCFRNSRFSSRAFKNFFDTIFKGCFSLIIITKYWLYSLPCTMHPWSFHSGFCTSHSPAPMFFLLPYPLVTSSFCCISVSTSNLLYPLECCIFSIPHVSDIMKHLSFSDLLHVA